MSRLLKQASSYSVCLFILANIKENNKTPFANYKAKYFFANAVLK